MEWASGELVSLLYYLLPGFFTAWVFHGLTAHRRAEPFERVVQALIFTAIITVPVFFIQWGLLFLGRHFFALGNWSKEGGFVASMFVAFFLGHLIAICANNNAYHQLLYQVPRKFFAGRRFLGVCSITKRTSFPSEWFSALNGEPRFVVLHLVDGRRIFGWPYEWPDHADAGHFVLMEAEWVLNENERAPLYNVERMIIPVSEVKFVDILKFNEEIQASADDEKIAEEKLIQYNRKLDDDTRLPEESLRLGASTNGK
ncbi:MAG: DUF6338 family protein [Pirellulaceae bacterium]